MFIGAIKNNNKTMNIYYLKNQHYISAFLVEVVNGSQKIYEEKIDGLGTLHDRISKFKDENYVTETN